ncbi:hypothetical protein AQ477_23885 [Burkholderia thailandensis]|nr:hypothetical protein AQ477_23885 [Burkholderia thailandensis]KXF58694.1 hypothetical protein AQ476_29020 [Burkholderia thailandensis]
MRRRSGSAPVAAGIGSRPTGALDGVRGPRGLFVTRMSRVTRFAALRPAIVCDNGAMKVR